MPSTEIYGIARGSLEREKDVVEKFSSWQRVRCVPPAATNQIVKQGARQKETRGGVENLADAAYNLNVELAFIAKSSAVE